MNYANNRYTCRPLPPAPPPILLLILHYYRYSADDKTIILIIIIVYRFCFVYIHADALNGDLF